MSFEKLNLQIVGHFELLFSNITGNPVAKLLIITILPLVPPVNPEITEGIMLIKNKNTAQYMEFFFYLLYGW